LATVERLLDLLRWAESAKFTTVLACHPTTSSGDHDLVVRRKNDSLGVFEVSDVAGAMGNSNKKMTADIGSLSSCLCPYCGEGAEKYLATSTVSGDWLSRLASEIDRMGLVGVSRLTRIAVIGTGTVITQLV